MVGQRAILSSGVVAMGAVRSKARIITFKFLLLLCFSFLTMASANAGNAECHTHSGSSAKLTLDRYMEAASLIQGGKAAAGVTILRDLASDGLERAGELADWAEFSSMDPKDRRALPEPSVVTRLKVIWRNSRLIPPASAGNSVAFSALQLLPREMDREVIDWVTEGIDCHPPFFAFEVVRRLLPTEIEEAAYWYVLGAMRVRYEVYRCKEPSLQDLVVLWLPYPAGEFLKVVGQEEFAPIYAKALKRVYENWDAAVPVEMKAWQYCRGNVAALKGDPIPIEEWKKANNRLREKVGSTIAKLDRN